MSGPALAPVHAEARSLGTLGTLAGAGPLAPPRFFWTAHPGDLSRQRLLPGSDVLIVASAFWDAARRRFRVRRPPADHIGRLAIDPGGFTVCAKYGDYPWTHVQLIDWARAESRDVPLAWIAAPDYACEREVNRTTYATNRERIKATIRNDRAVRALAPDLPWLSVLQGNTFAERALDVAWRGRLGLLFPVMGIGSICKRPPAEAAAVLRWYAVARPGVRFHAFGLDARALDSRAADLYAALASWDSYAWNWPRGVKGQDRPAALHKAASESYSIYTRRVAAAYAARVIAPRVAGPQQGVLPL